MSQTLICATCNRDIPDPGSVLVEWVVTAKGAAGFRIIHDLKSSPRGREGCSWHALEDRDDPIQDLPADHFLDPERFTEALAGVVDDLEGLLAIVSTLSEDVTDHLLRCYFAGRPTLTALSLDLFRTALAESLPRLISSLEEEGEEGRLAAGVLTALGESAAPALAGELGSAEPHVRRSASLALARMGEGAYPAATALSNALGDEEDEVRFKAAFTLKVLGGIEYQDQADAVAKELAPVMGAIDALEPFVAVSPLFRGVITEETLLTGEVIKDVTGRTFLAPEEDYRGGGMGSVALFGSCANSGSHVQITGYFDRDIGIWAASCRPLT